MLILPAPILLPFCYVLDSSASRARAHSPSPSPRWRSASPAPARTSPQPPLPQPPQPPPPPPLSPIQLLPLQLPMATAAAAVVVAGPRAAHRQAGAALRPQRLAPSTKPRPQGPPFKGRIEALSRSWVQAARRLSSAAPAALRAPTRRPPLPSPSLPSTGPRHRCSSRGRKGAAADLRLLLLLRVLPLSLPAVA